MAGGLRRSSKALVVLALALVVVGAGAGGTRAREKSPPTPTVIGPRDTSSTRPVYTFRSRGALSFRCAFDSTSLDRCGARYSTHLDPGDHVLRVRAVGRGGALSKLAVVPVRVRLPFPELQLGKAVATGSGAGVPAVGAGAVWVPETRSGMLARIDPGSGAVTTRVSVGSTSGGGDLDAAALANGAVWSASDHGWTIARVDPATNAVTAKLKVTSRPGGLAVGGGFVWAFHFLQTTVTRIDPSTDAVKTFEVPDLAATGIAYGDGAVWVSSVQPARILRIDPDTGTVRQTIPLKPPFPQERSLVETWWVSYGDGAAWTTLPNHQGIARVDAASGAVRYVRLAEGSPFGVAVGGGAAWIATDHAVWKLDGASGEPQAASLIPQTRSSFVSIVYADGAAWLSTYDPGTLTRVAAP